MGNACFLPWRSTPSRSCKLPDAELKIDQEAHHHRNCKPAVRKRHKLRNLKSAGRTGIDWDQRHKPACGEQNTKAALANDYEAEEKLRLSAGPTGIDWEAEKFIRNRLRKMNDEYMEEVSSINSS